MRGDELKPFALLAEMSDDEREALAELLEVRELPTGKSVFREGAEAEGLELLAEGTLILKSKRTGGVIASIDAPYHLGASSLFAVGKREVTAVADGPCVVWSLSRTGLARLAEDAPKAAFRLAEATAGELASLTRPILDALANVDLD